MNMEPIMQHVKDFAVDMILQERFYLWQVFMQK